MIRHYSADEFSRIFCYNRYRSELYHYFCEEINNIRRQCSQIRILVFGSFISEKEEPSDIDVLLSIIPNREWAYRVLKNGLQLMHEDVVDVQYNKHQLLLEDCDSLIKTFNTNKLNKKKKIKIVDAVEVLL